MRYCSKCFTLPPPSTIRVTKTRAQQEPRPGTLSDDAIYSPRRKKEKRCNVLLLVLIVQTAPSRRRLGAYSKGCTSFAGVFFFPCAKELIFCALQDISAGLVPKKSFGKHPRTGVEPFAVMGRGDSE